MGRRWQAVFLLVVAEGLLAGCALIAGVDQYQKGDCPGGCLDATLSDARADSTLDSTVGDSPGSDTGGDSPPMDAGVEMGLDVFSESGCGPLNTIQNCSKCDAACDMVHSNNPSCNGMTCMYQSCQMGWSNCDKTAPDLAGCECNTPGCCMSACETTHTNGLNQNFYDCVAQGTYNQTQAAKACTAYTGNQFACSMFTCAGDGGNLVICGTAGGRCACWAYVGTQQGRLYQSPDATCFCPGGNNPSWN